MYSCMEELDPRTSSIEYGLGPVSTMSNLGPITSAQQRSISRTSIYSTSSSDQESGVIISTLETVPRSRQSQSLGEIEMISNGNTVNPLNSKSEDNNGAEFSNNTSQN